MKTKRFCKRSDISSRKTGLVFCIFLVATPNAFSASDLIYDSLSTWNGKKVYLSPARHSDAGSRGECTGSAGMGSLDENTAAYRFAYYAASGNYIGSNISISKYRNLRWRGYKVRIPGVYAKRNQLSKAFNEMEARIGNDQRIVGATENWSNCMSNEGYSFSNPNDVFRQADEVVAGLHGENADQEKFDFANKALAITTKISEACDKQVGLSKIRQEVRVEYENQFVREYRPQLDE